MHSSASSRANPPVVVGIDGSRGHLATVDLGVAEAGRRAAPLLIVHVWPGRYSGSRYVRGPFATEADGRHLLDVAAQRAQHIAPGLVVDTDLTGGGAAQVLARLSESAQLVVVGHRDVELTRTSWGSTAAYLAHHGRCPLLVHRGAAPVQGPVVLAVSGHSSTATVKCAFEEAAMSGSRLVAVYVWTRASERADGRLEAATDYAADRRDADRYLAEAIAGWTGDYPDVTVERVTLHDLDVAYTLERASRRGRLLVAGMGRNGRFAELLYGSVGLALTRQAACPVMLVPSGSRLQDTPARPPGAAAGRAGGGRAGSGQPRFRRPS